MTDETYNVTFAPDYDDTGLDYTLYDSVIHTHYSVVGTTPPLITLGLGGLYLYLIYLCAREKPITLAKLRKNGGGKSFSRKKAVDMLNHLQTLELIEYENLDNTPDDQPFWVRMEDPLSPKEVEARRTELWERVRNSPVIPKRWKRDN